jgi:hypothetical protein
VDKKKIYFVSGMPRAGTTFLYHTLALHPSIFVPSRKEMDYFTVNFYRGESWYLSFFESMPEHQVGFDISPICFMDERAVERILHFNSGAKLILIIRDPVEWIFSLYKHNQAKRFRNIDFNKFLDGYLYKKDGKVMLLEFKEQKITRTIERYRDILGNNLLLCDFKLFNHNPLPLLKAIERFVNVPDFFSVVNFQNVRINASDQEPPRIVNILMQKKAFSDVITKIFPKKLIMSVRYKVQSSGDQKRKVRKGQEVPMERLELARKTFSEDAKYISTLFHRSPLVLGKGRIYEY